MFDSNFIILILAVLLANIVEAITGFGGIIIAVTIAANFFEIPWLVTVLVPINLAISVYIVARHYKKTDIHELVGGFAQVVRERKMVPIAELMYGILPFAMVGMAIGILVFSIAGSVWLKLAYGVFVLCFSIWELSRMATGADKAAAPPPMSRLKSAIWLMGGGFIQGVYGSGGPMIVYYSSKKLADKGVFRATLSVLWLVLNGIIMTTHIVAGRHDASTLKAIVALIPMLLLGVFIGEKLHSKMPERAFRVFVFSLLVFAGSALLISGARQAFGG
jgi:hypothetical protein